MSWVNLNDVYVNQTGGTIAGDLSVNGALTVNDGKGTNTTYNVANEITTLRDSVSQDTGLVYLMNGNNGYNTVAYRAKNGVCTLYVSAVFGLGANSEYKIANTIDAKYLPDLVCYCPLAYRQSNNVANVWIPAKTLEDNHLYIYSTYDNSTNVNSINGIVSWVY